MIIETCFTLTASFSHSLTGIQNFQNSVVLPYIVGFGKFGNLIIFTSVAVPLQFVVVISITELNPTTNVKHAHSQELTMPSVDKRSPTYANFRITHLTHLSSFHSAFYQQPHTGAALCNRDTQIRVSDDDDQKARVGLPADIVAYKLHK